MNGVCETGETARPVDSASIHGPLCGYADQGSTAILTASRPSRW